MVGKIEAWLWVGGDGYRIVFLDRVRAEAWAARNRDGRLYPLVIPEGHA